MTQENTFSYRYSAKENEELQEIRNRYLPRNESKLEEIKRLDKQVQTSGIVESLVAGIGGLLVFGFGMCLSMQVIGNGIGFVVLGILIGLIGIGGMAMAYPVYRRTYHKAREKYTPRILELSAELSGESI